ncbi:hypothetical protein LINGRAHAP2_LOCUS4163 [Linum grandiflorum]
MRVRVYMNVLEPLKIEKKVKEQGGDWHICSFKYEKLPTFCYTCGCIGHVDRNCEIDFRTPEADIVKLWDNSLRATPRRGGVVGGARGVVERPMNREYAGRGGLHVLTREERFQAPPCHSNMSALRWNLRASRWMANEPLKYGGAKGDVVSEGMVLGDRKRSRVEDHGAAIVDMEEDSRQESLDGKDSNWRIQDSTNLALAGLRWSSSCPPQ